METDSGLSNDSVESSQITSSNNGGSSGDGAMDGCEDVRIDAKKTFYQLLYANADFQKKLVSNRSIIKREKEHLKLIEEVKDAYAATKRNRRQVYLFGQYAILKIDDEDKLICKSQINDTKPLVYTFIESLYDDIKREHLLVGHGKRDKTHNQCAQQYKNITIEVVNIWLQTCLECIQRTRKNTISSLVVKPIRSSDYLSRGQVDLVNCEAYADGDFKYILNYQDHFTKFIQLRAMKSKTAAEVAWHLLAIFLTFGAPAILQSDNGKEFRASVVEELTSMWPDLKIVHGRARHPQSQGSVERSNGEMKKLLGE
jgi:hypothetical protein